MITLFPVYTLYLWKCIDPCRKWNNVVWNVTFRLEGEPVWALSGSVCECWCSGALCSAERLLPAASDLCFTPRVRTQCCAALLLQLWAGSGNDDDLYFFKVTFFVFCTVFVFFLNIYPIVLKRHTHYTETYTWIRIDMWKWEI